MNRGKFIVLEGIDGSGKSTQISLLQKKLEECGIPSVAQCEPTQRPMGLLLRKYLSGELQTDELAIAELFAADRTDHITAKNDGLRDILRSGRNVICDRYCFSSYAYNCHNYSVETVMAINRLCTSLLRADLTVFIDIPVDMALERIRNGRTETEIYENEAYLRTVRRRYFEAFAKTKETECIAIVDGMNSPGEISRIIFDHVMHVINEGKR